MRRGSVENFLKVPVQGFVPEAGAVAPASPVVGQLWTDTSTGKVKYWNGTTWVSTDGSTIPAGSITDSMIASGANISLSKLAVNPLDRANHTGTQLSSTISDFNTAVRINRLDQLAAPTATVDFNGQRISNLAAPINGSDVVTKSYADGLRAGITGIKDPVRVAATANVSVTVPTATIDGVTLSANDRVLLTNQSTTTENGIYVWNSASTPLTRAQDADGTGEVLDGTIVAVAEGTQAGYQFIQTATASGAPGAWTQVWQTYSVGGQTYSAGTGLTLAGSTFSLTTPVSIANGGTGATTAAGVRTALSVPGKYAADLGALTAGGSTSVTHSLNTTDVVVSFKTTSDNTSIDFSWQTTGANTLAVLPDVAFASAAVRIIVVG